MKQAVKFLVVAAVAVSTSFLGSTTFAQGGHFGGSHGNFHGGRYYGGYRGYWGGWGWRGWFPWGFSFVYAPSPYYYYPYYYSSTAYYPSTTYYAPSAVYSSQPAEAYNSPPIQRSDQGQSIDVADVKALAKAGVSDEVILSHIRNSHAVYPLTTAEIIDLKQSGVSEKIIDFMINAASTYQTQEHPSSDTGLLTHTPADDFSSSVTVTTDPTVVVRDEIKKLAESVKRLSPGRQRMEIFYTLQDKHLVVSGAEFAYLMTVTDPFYRSDLLETGLQHSFILLPISEGDQKFLLEEIPANVRGRVSDLLQSVQPTGQRASTASGRSSP
jgi:hypothetical protein